MGYLHRKNESIQPFALVELSEKYSFEITEITGAKHDANSRHYFGIVVDIGVINGKVVSAEPPDFKAFMKDAKKLGATEVLGPGSKGHNSHIHIGWPRSDINPKKKEE